MLRRSRVCGSRSKGSYRGGISSSLLVYKLLNSMKYFFHTRIISDILADIFLRHAVYPKCMARCAESLSASAPSTRSASTCPAAPGPRYVIRRTNPPDVFYEMARRGTESDLDWISSPCGGAQRPVL